MRAIRMPMLVVDREREREPYQKYALRRKRELLSVSSRYRGISMLARARERETEIQNYRMIVYSRSDYNV
jgi:hypothetical protein